MSKSQGSCSWQWALCCQQLLTGETHWPKIRKLACIAKGPTSPVSCHSHSFYTAPLQERWSLVQENNSLELGSTNEGMAVCLLDCMWSFLELVCFWWVPSEMASSMALWSHTWRLQGQLPGWKMEFVSEKSPSSSVDPTCQVTGQAQGMAAVATWWVPPVSWAPSQCFWV